MIFKLEKYKSITSSYQAVATLALVLCSDEFVHHQNSNDPDFWDDVIVFCNKWDIPFNKELHQLLRAHQAARPSLDQDPDEWESSDNNG